MAVVAAFEGFAAGEHVLHDEPEIFTRRVQSQLPRGGEDGVLMQDGDFLAFGAREFFEAFAQFNFFAGEELGVESAEFSEGGGFTKNKRAGHQSQPAADAIPQGGDGVASPVAGFEADGAAAGEAVAGGDLCGDVVEEFGGRVGVGIDEDEPVAGGGFGAAIARAADLVDGLEDNGGAGGARDFRGAVGGVVIAHDEFGLPVAPRKCGHGGVDLAKGFAEEPFFVKGGNYDRDAHAKRLSVQCPMSKGQCRGKAPSAPSSKLQRNSKLQVSNGRRLLRVWCLEFLWSLELGIWSFQSGKQGSTESRPTILFGRCGRCGRLWRILFAADDGQGLDGFGGDGVDGVHALGEQGLDVGGFGDFGFVGRGGKDVHGFDDFFVELEPFAVARGGLPEGAVDDARDAVEADGAAFEVIAINGAENVLGGDVGERVGRFVGTHGLKMPQGVESGKLRVSSALKSLGVVSLRVGNSEVSNS